MSTDTSTDSTENSKPYTFKTIDSTKSDGNELKSHIQQGGRYFLKDPETGESLNVSLLTAYAEYGRKIYDRDAHHEIPLLKVDAPKFLDALPREEHARYHRQEPDPVDVDGFPLFRTEL